MVLSFQASQSSHVSQQPAVTLRLLPHSVFEQLEHNRPKAVVEARKTMYWLHELLAKGLSELRSKYQDNGTDTVNEDGKSQSEGKDGDGFSLSLDVQRLSPEELKVKVFGRKVLVTGKHEKKSDDGSGSYSYKYEEFRREFQLPEDVDAQALNCCLSQDGRLKVQAPRLALPAVNGRTVPINITSDTTTAPRLNPGKEAQKQDGGKDEGNKEEAEGKKDI
uniref:heat shock protein 30C-like n=1 Tax=Pristiophorus japonicus TaxID=55135 RepID=UPI00398E7E3C